MATKNSITKNISTQGSIAPDVSYDNPVLNEKISAANKMAGIPQQPSPAATNMQQPASPSIMDSLRDQAEQNKQYRDQYTQNLQQLTPKQQPANKQQNAPVDYDNEPHGFDHSDKMSMLGSLVVGAGVGVTDMVMGVEQLLARSSAAIPQMESKALSYIPGETAQKLSQEEKNIADYSIGGSKELTDLYNRHVSRSKLVQNARNSHPIVFGLSNLASNIASTGKFLNGMAKSVSGEPILGDELKAVNDVISATERIGGKGSFGVSLKNAIRDSAAKSLINAKKTFTASSIAKLTGEGVAFNEMQYDPETNHYAGSDAAAGAMALIFGAGGKMVSGFARPLAKEISKIKDDFNVSLPLMPSWEKLAKWLPTSDYGKLAVTRAKQIFSTANQIKEKLLGQSDESIANTINQRINEVNAQLSDETISHYQKTKYEKELSSLNAQRNQIGTTAGYSQYLMGNAKDDLRDARNKSSDMNEKLGNKTDAMPDIDVTKVSDAAKEIITNEEMVHKSLRRSSLLRVASDIKGSKQSEELNDIFSGIGINNPEQRADVLEDFLNGKLYKKSPDLYRKLQPYQDDLSDILHKEGVPHGSIDKSDLAMFSDAPTMSASSLRINRTRIGAKMESATNSYEKKKYSRLYAAITSAYEDHINKYGDQETLDLFREQNRLNHDIIHPLGKIIDEYSGLGDKNADNFIWKFLKPGEPNATSALLKLMPKNEETSRMAIKASLLHSAYKDSHIEGIGLNPVKFVNELLRLKESSGVHFNDEEMDVLKGYQSLVNRVQKIMPEALLEGKAEGWETKGSELTKKRLNLGGKSAIGLVGIGIGAKMGSGVLLPLLLTGYGFSKLVTSETGRTFMKHLSSLGTDVSEEKVNPIIKNVFKYLGFYPMIEASHKIISEKNKQE